MALTPPLSSIRPSPISAALAMVVLAVGLPAGARASSAAPEQPPSTTVPAAPATDEHQTGTLAIPDPTTPDDTAPSTTLGPDASEPDTADDDADETPAAVQPTIRTTGVPVGSFVLAVAVLAAAVLAWRIAARRSGGRESATASVPTTAATAGTIDPTTLSFLVELGEALVDAGDAVHNVTSTLEDVARVNGAPDLGAIVLPTALVLSLPGGDAATTEVAIAGRSGLRLDQIESVMDVVDRAEQGELTPADGCRELRAIRARPHPSSTAVRLLGSGVAAAGLALVLRGGPAEVVLAAVLGTLIGLMSLTTASARYIYRPFWPVLASFVVAVATFTTLRIADIVAFPALVAPLITFLPGALLTIAVLELATGQILAGSSRLASGLFQLVLLAIGIVAGAQVVGVPASAVGSAPVGPVAVAGPWIGVAVFGLGIAWSQGLRPAATPWVLVVLYVAYAGQVVGGVFVGSALSAFFGAVAMTPVAVVLARRGLGPPTLVMFFPGFWMLVPGALGLEGVTRIIGDDRISTTGALTTSLTSMVGISLGVLLGVALSAPDPERPWALSGHRRRAA